MIGATEALHSKSPGSSSRRPPTADGGSTSRRRSGSTPGLRRDLRSNAAEAIWFGGLIGLAFATAFIVSGLSGLSAGAELYVGLSGLMVLIVGVAGIIIRSLLQMRSRLEGLAFELATTSRAVAALQVEAGMLREVVNAIASAPAGTIARAKPEFGMLGDRQCARLGDGTVIVETMVGYRRFESEADAEAFTGSSKFRPVN